MSCGEVTAPFFCTCYLADVRTGLLLGKEEVHAEPPIAHSSNEDGEQEEKSGEGVVPAHFDN